MTGEAVREKNETRDARSLHAVRRKVTVGPLYRERNIFAQHDLIHLSAPTRL
jgi:hypothetical protein